MRHITVHTSRRQVLVDITADVQMAVVDMPYSAVLLYVPHTTAGIFINEHADPDVAADVVAALDMMVPDSDQYRHAEGNTRAHVKSIVVGSSQMIPLVNGALGLGRWQGVFLAEFDGPRQRTVTIVPLP